MFELVSSILAALLTLALLSYLIGDNPVYRAAAHLFIGLSAGYAVVLAWHTVIRPHMLAPLQAGLASGFNPAVVAGLAGALAGAGLGVLLLLKTVRVAGRAGTLVLALMAGVGAAAAVGGAISGTLLPQTSAAFVSLLPTGPGWVERGVEAVFMVIGTLATLAFFYYGANARPGRRAERPAFIRPLASLGQVFIGAAFGVMYAGAVAAGIAIFSERSAALWSLAAGLFP